MFPSLVRGGSEPPTSSGEKTPAKTKQPVLTQLCKLIPPHLVATLAGEHGSTEKRAPSYRGAT
ncbi:MAG: hypothetical protein ACI9UA_006059 [Pseudoalteromonas tetraodonis]|jgi:hypothetical protein